MDARPVVHLINPVSNASGGSEQRSLMLFKLLAGHGPVRLWSESPPDPLLAAHYPIRVIRKGPGNQPNGGILVIIGLYFDLGDWLVDADPDRTIIVVNTFSGTRLLELFVRLKRCGVRQAELVYASQWLKDRIGLPGSVEFSPIDIDRFRPAPVKRQRSFTVGKMSRDVPEKHHPEDIGLYRALVQQGCRIRIMGGSCLTDALGHMPGVELIPAGAEPAPDFLNSLDCFFYRTAETWKEAFGRVVAEAMACGLPVVCRRRGGYTEVIQDCNNGFLFDTSAQAMAGLASLKNDPTLAGRIGAAARNSMLTLYGPDALKRIADYYAGTAHAPHSIAIDQLNL